MPESLKKMRQERKDSEDLLQVFRKYAIINGSVKKLLYAMEVRCGARSR